MCRVSVCAQKKLRTLCPVRTRLGHVVGWHPNCDSSANYSSRVVIELKRRKRPKSHPTEPPRIVRLLEQAERWQRMLGCGEATTRAELAKRAGVSANRVTNLLALLKLDPTTVFVFH